MRWEGVKEEDKVISTTDNECEEMAFKNEHIKSYSGLQSIVLGKLFQKTEKLLLLNELLIRFICLI